MTDKKRVLAGFLVSLAVLSVIGMGLGGVNGQILSEVSYYQEDFSEYNETAVQLAADDNLQNQYLTDLGAWNSGTHGGTHNDYGVRYGDASQHVHVEGIETNQPFFSRAVHRYDHDGWGGTYAYREISIPDGIQDPVLVAEVAAFKQYNGDVRFAFGTENKVVTWRDYDQSPGHTLSRGISGKGSGDWNKVGTIPTQEEHSWKTYAFPVSGNTTSFYVNTHGTDGNNYHQGAFIRNLYVTEGSTDAFQTEVNGWSSIPEDDSFGGPDPYKLAVVNKPTAEGEQVSMRSYGSNVKREFQLDGIDDAQNAYFVLEGTSHSSHPVQYTVKAFGQQVASGSISPQSTSEETVELDLDTDEVTVVIQSRGNYDIHSAQFTALEQTSAGDPLAKNNKPGGITLNPDKGYDRTVGVLISGLDVTTDTLLFIVMIALTVGFMVFSYTKSVRGQEMAQSLLFGAVIAGVVIVGVVPTMNLATWIFTGDVDRAPLADPALEAEPPTYYSTEFQDGTKHGWEFDHSRGQGSVRPVSVGEGFDLRFTGSGSNAGIIKQQTHISLGNSLSTGFVQVDGAAESVAGYNNNPHEVTYNIRVYVTDDGNLDDSDRLDPNTNYVENGQSLEYLRNPVTDISQVNANVDGSTMELSDDFTIVDAAEGKIRYEGNSTLRNNENYTESLANPTIRYNTHRNDGKTQSFSNVAPGDTLTLNKDESSQNVAAVDEVARSFNGETMSNEKMVTFDLDGQYVHTELIVRSNRDDEDPVGTLASVRVGATTEGGSAEH
jgi:hypothetical protein